jgi:serine protease Do
MRGAAKLDLTMEIIERPDEENKFAHMVSKESNLVRPFGILALNMSEKFSNLTAELRVPAGVIVAAKVAGWPHPSEEFEAGDLIGAVNGFPITGIDGLRAILAKMQPGDPVVVSIQRGPKLTMLAFELP